MGARSPVTLLGGTFDPVHYGHLRLADEVRVALQLPDVRLVPAGDPPHRAGPVASAADRVAMLDLAVQAFPGLRVDAREIARPGKSYTVLTLEELRAEDARRPIILLLGADAFRGLPTWHRWRDILTLAHIVVVARPGTELEAGLPQALGGKWTRCLVLDPRPLKDSPAGAIYRQSITPQPIAASSIRAQLARGPEGRPEVRELLPPAVLAYIEQHHLYHPPPDAT
jgi:nicotinate-nucleotide adenylyltransferase